MPAVSQLRVYTVKPGAMDDWVREWKEKIYPLRRKHGFQILGAWVVEPENKFVWILHYDGPEDWATKDGAYYASEDRKNVSPDPVRHLAKTEHWFLRPVLNDGPAGI